MTEYLIFRLYGPMASWGEIAVGEVRHSARHPSRSGLIGLLAAACGIDRKDEEQQRRMIAGYRFGLKVESFGSPLLDYHTTQYGVPERRQRFRSRRDELENGKERGTLLSAREYRCDSVALAAVEALPGAPYGLGELKAALRQPQYVLYLGRKSCPPAVPLAPTVVSADDLQGAFDQVALGSLAELASGNPWPTWEDRRRFDIETVYFWEDGIVPGMKEDAVAWRHDQPISRSRWQFLNRREWTAQKSGSV